MPVKALNEPLENMIAKIKHDKFNSSGRYYKKDTSKISLNSGIVSGKVSVIFVL